MLSKAWDGSINYYQMMDEQGNIDPLLFPKDLDDKTVIEMYKWMSLTRAADSKSLSLQRQGRLQTYGPSMGQEATQIGAAMAMRKDDLFVPNFRQHGVFITRGLPMHLYFLSWKGYEEGNVIPKEVGGLPYNVPVATQIPHAVGLAYAQKYLKKDVAVVTFVGDGGTSEGDFYEGMNFAGVWKLPLVIIIENNQWAISVPRSRQSAAKTLAQKAVAAGINGVQVDGNDVVAVYKAVTDAINNAKNGPTVIECVTYRIEMHTTSDDPTKYRSQEEVDSWKKKDPIMRVKAYLTKKGLWDDKKEQQLAKSNLDTVDDAVDKAEKFKPDPKSMFMNIYSYMPDVLKQELDAAVAADFWQEDEK